jgi:hypothetical protein
MGATAPIGWYILDDLYDGMIKDIYIWRSLMLLLFCFKNWKNCGRDLAAEGAHT